MAGGGIEARWCLLKLNYHQSLASSPLMTTLPSAVIQVTMLSLAIFFQFLLLTFLGISIILTLQSASDLLSK
jgi:hypothetical protein